MKKLVDSRLFLGASILFTALNSAHAETVTQAKAAELALHRVERLVVLKKIEESFETKIKNLRLELVSHSTPDAPSYKVTILQYPGADGKQKALELMMNEEGKALTSNVLPGSDAVNSPTWPDKDPVTLCENSLHYVLEGASTKPELVPFFQKLTSFSLSEGTNAAGEKVAVVDMRTNDRDPILKVKMKMDGTFDSAEFVNRTLE
jgi:hypothetical protein